MYIHIGNNRHILSNTLIGIFDIDTTTTNKYTKKFLSMAQEKNSVEATTTELPRAFIVSVPKRQKWQMQKIYLTQISTATLKERATSSKSQAAISNKNTK